MKQIKKVTFRGLPRAHKYIDRALNLGFVCSLVGGPAGWVVRVMEVAE